MADVSGNIIESAGAAGGGAPSGAAGGVLSGTYPDPGFAADMATQAELDTAIGTAVLKSLYDAQTVLAATSDNTPAAITMAASTVLARLAAGNIVAATPAEIKTLLATALDDLTDAAIATPAAGQRLMYDGTNFVNQATLEQTCIPGGIGSVLYDRTLAGTGTCLVSQRLSLYAIYLPKGVTCTTLTFISGTQAAVTPVHQLFGLYDDAAGSASGTARALLRGTADATSGAWAANTAKPLALTSTYVTPKAGLYYVGILVDAATVPDLFSRLTASTTITGIAPILCGTSNTAVTALPNPANAITAGVAYGYCYVS